MHSCKRKEKKQNSDNTTCITITVHYNTSARINAGNNSGKEKTKQRQYQEIAQMFSNRGLILNKNPE